MIPTRLSYMPCHLACIMAMLRVVCSNWGATMFPTRLFTTLLCYKACFLAMFKEVISSSRWGTNLFLTKLSIIIPCHLACIMAVCRGICSSLGARMFPTRLGTASLFYSLLCHHYLCHQDCFIAMCKVAMFRTTVCSM